MPNCRCNEPNVMPEIDKFYWDFYSNTHFSIFFHMFLLIQLKCSLIANQDEICETKIAVIGLRPALGLDMQEEQFMCKSTECKKLNFTQKILHLLSVIPLIL